MSKISATKCRDQIWERCVRTCINADPLDCALVWMNERSLEFFFILHFYDSSVNAQIFTIQAVHKKECLQTVRVQFLNNNSIVSMHPVEWCEPVQSLKTFHNSWIQVVRSMRWLNHNFDFNPREPIGFYAIHKWTIRRDFKSWIFHISRKFAN